MHGLIIWLSEDHTVEFDSLNSSIPLFQFREHQAKNYMFVAFTSESHATNDCLI